MLLNLVILAVIIRLAKYWAAHIKGSEGRSRHLGGSSEESVRSEGVAVEDCCCVS